MLREMYISLQQNQKKTSNDVFFKKLLVGTAGFEPTTPCPPGRCATKLRHAPTPLL